MAAKRTQGSRAGLSRDQILDAALELADAEGLGALTMRRLGAALGVEAMTLYHYVPNKNALIDGLVERIFTAAQPAAGPAAAQPAAGPAAAQPAAGPAAAQPAAAPDADWRSHLEAYAEALRATLLAHPGVLPVIVRPAATPATLDAVEDLLRLLTGSGFPLARALDALNALVIFVIAHTAAEATITAPAPLGFDPGRHPLLAEAARTGAGLSDHARFRYAVQALLAGLTPLERS
jgi:AcrR family transcriptional regulator